MKGTGQEFYLRRDHMAAHPEFHFWAEPCVGCFRTEDEAIFYFRKNHAGCVYKGIRGEREVHVVMEPLEQEESCSCPRPPKQEQKPLRLEDPYALLRLCLPWLKEVESDYGKLGMYGPPTELIRRIERAAY